MLIKTIQLETDDEKLFSKSAPLLAAAAECAYYTVKCSGKSENSKLCKLFCKFDHFLHCSKQVYKDFT